MSFLNKNHTLFINYQKDNPTEDSLGTFGLDEENTSIILIKKDSGYQDTLIHELCHFILFALTGNWFNHTKKFYKLYNFLKDLTQVEKKPPLN